MKTISFDTCSPNLTKFSGWILLIFIASMALASAFSSGDTVQATSNLNVRSSASTTGSLVTTVSSGSVGTVSGSSVYANNYYWWYINWKNGYSGWSVQDYLVQVPPVTLTLYVRNGSSSGPVIPGAQVTGYDAAGTYFSQTTGSGGYVTVTGKSGTWSFTASASGYSANSWSQGITSSTTLNAFVTPTAVPPVTLTLYIRNGSASGPVISGAQVTGNDAAGASFSQTTGSGGYVTITGKPGTWSFTATASGYSTNSWSQGITSSTTLNAFVTPTAVPPVTLTLYIRNGSASGPVISGAQVTGYDAAGASFSQTTGSGGYVTITGKPGSWSFTVAASGYNSNSWSQGITSSTTLNAFVTPTAVSQVTLTLYIRNGSASGPVLSGAQVTGSDASGASFSQTTGSGGYVTIIGKPGSWNLTASASGYNANSWSQNITATTTLNAFVTPTATQQVKSPIFSPAGDNTSTSAMSVTMSCATSGATIRYTTNGSDPTSTSTVYAGSLTISNTTTVKARAFKSGMTESAVTSATFTINSGSSSNRNSLTVSDAIGSKRVLTSGDTVWISSLPAMPSVFPMNIATGTKPTETSWRWTSTFDSHTPSARQLPSADKFATAPYGTTWDFKTAYFSNDFFGGNVTIIGGNNISGLANSVSFKIRGLNPRDATLESYALSIGMPWFGTAILKKETRSKNYVYNQFLPSGSNKGSPVFGAPHGWGMGQIDRGSDNAITSSEMWNWKINLSSAKAVIATKTSYAKSYFNKIKATYPTEWESPPTYTPPNTSTTLTALEASTIQLYNGAAVIKNIGGANYLSAYAFKPSAASGKRWSFVPNPLNPNYVTDVVKEFEKQFTTVDE